MYQQPHPLRKEGAYEEQKNLFPMPCPLVSLLNFLKTRDRGGQGTDRAETALENQPGTDHIRCSTSRRPGPCPVPLHTSAPGPVPGPGPTTPAASRPLHRGRELLCVACAVVRGTAHLPPAQTTHSGWERSAGDWLRTADAVQVCGPGAPSARFCCRL